MNRVYSYLQAYHPIVHTLMAGTVFITLTSSMSMPFLAIYLNETTQLDYAAIGLIIGAGPLAGTLGGFFGGVLSDFLGRTRLMILSLMVLSLVFFGFVIAANPLILLLLSIFRGLAASFFTTISKALMGDVTPEEKRFRMFSNRYLATNLGFSVGPVLGAFLGIGGGAITFLFTAAVYLLYSLVLLLSFRLYPVKLSGGETSEKITAAHAWNVLSSDFVLFLFILGGVMLTTVHGQMSVTLSQHLQENIADGVKLFGVLMSLNGITVLLAQVPLTRWSEKFSLFRRIALGGLLLAAGEAGFAFSAGWIGFILAMVIFTLGEILVIPAEYAQIDQITPPGMRGTYYGAQSFSELGNFLGPWFGGILLSLYGGKTMFLAMALISVASLLFYWKGRQLYEARLKHATFADVN
jgi:MFS family permease